MKPTGLLMIEHRRIERVIVMLSAVMRQIQQHNDFDRDFINFAVDFFRTYADRTHHGKEEDILFARLAGKNLNHEDNETMNTLIQEHVRARETVSRLSDSHNQYCKGNQKAADTMVNELQKLIELYPAHIEKEDKRFFAPAMTYFSDAEKQQMLRDFSEFDKMMIHEKYEALVKAKEKEILAS